MKIHVTGNAGSGKTTFAGEVADRLHLPLFGLDKIVWQPGWVKTPPAQRAELEQKLIEQDKWVIEGVSARVRRGG